MSRASKATGPDSREGGLQPTCPGRHDGEFVDVFNAPPVSLNKKDAGCHVVTEITHSSFHSTFSEHGRNNPNQTGYLPWRSSFGRWACDRNRLKPASAFITDRVRLHIRISRTLLKKKYGRFGSGLQGHRALQQPRVLARVRCLGSCSPNTWIRRSRVGIERLHFYQGFQGVLG